MIPNLFHIYGPLYLNCYGLAIFLGIVALYYMAQQDTEIKKQLNADALLTIVFNGILIGILGGRALWAVINWHSLTSWVEVFEIWYGGFSILGTILGVLLLMPWFIKTYKLSISFFDRIAIYAPLAQAFGRLGCFFAGCCYGAKTTLWCGITYSHPASAAPLFTKIHPTQLYSSIMLVSIFLFMYFVADKYLKQRGQLILAYLTLAGCERFLIDFFRDDREFFVTLPGIISINQVIALLTLLVAFALFLYSIFYRGKRHIS